MMCCASINLRLSQTLAEAKCLVLDRESFNLLLGPLKDIIEAAREGRQRPERAAPEAQGCALDDMWLSFSVSLRRYVSMLLMKNVNSSRILFGIQFFNILFLSRC